MDTQVANTFGRCEHGGAKGWLSVTSEYAWLEVTQKAGCPGWGLEDSAVVLEEPGWHPRSPPHRPPGSHSSLRRLPVCPLTCGLRAAALLVHPPWLPRILPYPSCHPRSTLCPTFPCTHCEGQWSLSLSSPMLVVALWPGVSFFSLWGLVPAAGRRSGQLYQPQCSQYAAGN